MKKIIALVLVCLTLMSLLTVTAAASQETDLIRYVPSKMIVTPYKITVEGYFMNMNTNLRVDSFEGLSLDFYHDGSFLFTADFSQMITCSVGSGRIRKQDLDITMSNGHQVPLGTYVCDDRYYTYWNGYVNWTWN